jgi:hypothetical protein
MTTEELEKLRARVRAAKHLPKFMRDFHDQKDLFKTIQVTMEDKNPETCKAVNWINGQCYCIDVFLKFMAIHGYELRKVNHATSDLTESINARREREAEAFKAYMDSKTSSGVSESR